MVCLPAELADWLLAAARDHAGSGDGYRVDRAADDLVARGLYLLRELMCGVPSAVSTQLLDDALARLDVKSGAPGRPGEPITAETLTRRYRRYGIDRGPLLPVLDQRGDSIELNQLAECLPDVERLFRDHPDEWMAKDHVVKQLRGHHGHVVRVAIELLALDGVIDLRLGPRRARLCRLARPEAVSAS